MKSPLRAVVIPVAVLLFGYFVWPTPWSKGVVNGDSVRSNRFNGCTYVLTGAGWLLTDTRDQCRSAADRRAAAEYEAAEKAKEEADAKWLADHASAYANGKAYIIDQMGDARLSTNTVFSSATVKLYNPTRCHIQAMKISLNGREYSNKTYTIAGAAAVGPQSAGDFEFEIFNPAEEVTNWYFTDVTYGSFTPDGETVRTGDPTCLEQ